MQQSQAQAQTQPPPKFYGGRGILCRDLAAQLEARWPDAAASLREGLEDMFTVRRLGVGGRLAASLTTMNGIQSGISIARRPAT